MPLFTVDPNNVFGKMIDEAGTYNVKVLPTSQLVTAKSGKQMVTLNFEVLDGKYAGGEIRYENVVWDDSTTEKYYQSITRFNTILVAAKVPAGTEIADLGAFTRGMVGKQLAVNTDWEQANNGNYYLRVTGYRNYQEDGSKPNGVKRPQGNSNNRQGNGFTNNYQQQNTKQPTNNGFANNGGFNNPNNNQEPIRDDQLPF